MILNDDELRYARTFDDLRDIIYYARDNDRWTTNHVLDLIDIESMLADEAEQVREDAKLFSAAIKPIIDYCLDNIDYNKVNPDGVKEIVREQEKDNLKYIEHQTLHWLFYEILGHIENKLICK